MSGPAATSVQAWLDAAPPEDVLLPDLPIVDPHHHLWDRGGHRYLHGDLLRDLGDGHRVEATVHVECRSAYREDGPEALRPVGETAFVVGEAEAAGHGVAAGIIAFADLALGGGVGAVLDAHEAAAAGRLRGVRYATAYDADASIHSPYDTIPAMLVRPEVRAGLQVLADRGLSFDAWLYFTQLDELAAAADTCPALTIVVDHLGGPIGIGPYAGRRDELFPMWRAAIARLAERPNVRIKLGGLGMAMMGFGFRKAGPPPSSETLAAAWRPYVETAIELFGAERAMFESNYPVDMSSCSYRTLFNTFKRLTAGASEAERAALFAGTARATYRLSA